MVVNVHPDDMPQDVHLIQLYQDVLLDLFTRRIENSDEYLDEVQASGWEIAPETPDRFKKLLADTPFTRDYDDDGGSGAELREEVKDWSDGEKKVAKAIQKEFGVDNDSFTYSDVADLKGSFKKSSLRPYFSQTFSEEGYAKKTGEKEGNAILWRWTKSIYASDAVADGGITDEFRNYRWSIPQSLNTDEVVQAEGLNPTDWFAAHNMDEFLEVYAHAEAIHDWTQEVNTTRDKIEKEYLPPLNERDAENVRDTLNQIKDEFLALFSIVSNQVVTSLHDVAGCCQSNVTAANQKGVAEEYKPRKKKDIQNLRLEAKRWAIIKTYIDPILSYYPIEVAVADKKQEQFAAHLHDLEEVVHAFLQWLWVCYQDIEQRANQRNVSIDQATLRLLRRHKGKGGSDAIGFTRLRDHISREFDVGVGDDELFEVLHDLATDDGNYSVRVWVEGEEPETRKPKNAPSIHDLEVEVSYEEEYEPDTITWLRVNAHDFEA